MRATAIAFHVADDSGVLALVDFAAYSTFVDEDWQYEQLLGHFKAQAQQRCIIVWDANDGGGNYRVEVRHGITELLGYRSVVAAIRVTAGALHLASYTALTMAAQYADQCVPSRDETHWRVPLENADYRVRIVQLFDPDLADELPRDAPHFVLEVEAGAGDPTQNVAWFSALPEAGRPCCS